MAFILGRLDHASKARCHDTSEGQLPSKGWVSGSQCQQGRALASPIPLPPSKGVRLA